jgi:hypothetical protein
MWFGRLRNVCSTRLLRAWKTHRHHFEIRFCPIPTNPVRADNYICSGGTLRAEDIRRIYVDEICIERMVLLDSDRCNR